MTTSLTAWIVSQGEEILTGQTIDTNANFLAAQLTAAGLRVLGSETAGDRHEAIVAALTRATSSASVVICTGGLGPTTDDLTAAAAAESVGRDLRLSEEALAQVVARFERAGRPMADANRKQGEMPLGSAVLANPIGTAPGFALTTDGGTRAYFLPGVPREMKRMWHEQVLPDLQRAVAIEPPQRALFRVIGLGESQLQELLGDIPGSHEGVVLGFRAKAPETQVKLVAEPGNPKFTGAVELVRGRLGSKCFSDHEDRDLAFVIGETLTRRGETLATAESCTGGLVADLCVSQAGSSGWFERGFVTYSNAAKVAHIGVPESLLAEHGAVSEATARAMATGVCAAAGAAWGVAVTGIAGPGGGTPEKPVGTVWVAVAGPPGVHARRLFLPTGDRNTTRQWSAVLALEMLRRSLGHEERSSNAADGRPLSG